jgi:prepilin-type N-terminal cleavage/methylation domain-containing protein
MQPNITQPLHQRHQAFTLVEVMIAVALFSTIVALVAGFAYFYFRNYSFSFSEHQAVSESQAALTQLIRDIRRSRPGDDGSWPIVQADDNAFTFYADVTGDNRTDRVRYFLNGTTLQRGVIQPTTSPITYPVANEAIQTVISSIQTGSTPIFRYYNGAWPSDTINNPLIASQRILNTRFVKVSMQLIPSGTGTGKSFELTSGVAIRSLKDNL